MGYRVFQFRRMTDAQRLTLTPQDGEGIWTTDTDLLYVGDGSTAGGLLAGSGAFLKLSGGTLTGLLTANGGITAGAGTTVDLDAATSVTVGLLSMKNTPVELHAIPLHTQFATTPANGDGARSSRYKSLGYTGSSVLHYITEIDHEHDGSGNDQHGRIIFRLNGSASGVGAMDEVLRLTRSLADFTQEVRHPFGRIAAYGRTSIYGMNSLTYVPVRFASTDREDTGFSINSGGNYDEVTCTFAGDCLVTVDCSAEGLAGPAVTGRLTTLWQLQVDTGSGFNAVPRTTRGMEHRPVTSIGRHGINTIGITRLVSVSSGDKFRFVGKEESGDTTPLGFQTIADGLAWTFERKQSTS